MGLTVDPRIRFSELIAAVVLWSVIRAPLNVSGARHEIEFIGPAQDLIANRFHRGYFKGRKIDLIAALRLNERFARFKLRGTPRWEWHEQREEILKAAKLESGRPKGWRPQRTETYLDLQAIEKGFAFLGNFAALQNADAPQMRGYFEQLLKLEWELIPNDCGVDAVEFGTPYDFDRRVMALAAIYFATGTADQGVQGIVEPIFALGSGAHYWINTFLTNFFDHAPSLLPADAQKAESWKAMIGAAKASPRWDENKTGLNQW